VHPVGSRRVFLIAAATALAAACTRPTPRRVAPTPAELPIDFDAWTAEARGILSDVLETLETFEAFTAFRLSRAEHSEQRSMFDLAWDPPTPAAWSEAIHVAAGLNGRSEQLFLNITNRQLSPTVWREQREAARAATSLRELGDALQQYQFAIQHLSAASDATPTWPLLDTAEERWQASANLWAVRRSELIACESR
jgi:hypothetical protein